VRVSKRASYGDTVRFSIDYDATVDNGNGLTFIGARPHTPRQIWSQGETTGNHLWFPTYDAPNDKATWDIEATIAAGDALVSNGALIGDAPAAGGTHTVHWRQDKPASTYLA